MNIKDYAEEVLMNLSFSLPGDKYDLQITEGLKNNRILTGISVMEHGSVMAPVFYVDGHFENDFPPEEVANEISGAYKIMQIPPELKSFAAGMTEYDPSHITYVVRNKSNKDLIKNSITRPVAGTDLVKILKVYEDHEEYRSSATVTPALLSKWDITPEEAFDDAEENIRKSFSVDSMSHVLSKISGIEIPEDDFSLCIVSNTRMQDGAAVIASPAVRKELKEMLRDNYYIIPSSIHEVIIIPAREMAGTGIVKEMPDFIKDINNTAVSPEDRLSDNFYFCDGDVLSIAAESGTDKTVHRPDPWLGL